MPEMTCTLDRENHLGLSQIDNDLDENKWQQAAWSGSESLSSHLPNGAVCCVQLIRDTWHCPPIHKTTATAEGESIDGGEREKESERKEGREKEESGRERGGEREEEREREWEKNNTISLLLTFTLTQAHTRCHVLQPFP